MRVLGAAVLIAVACTSGPSSTATVTTPIAASPTAPMETQTPFATAAPDTATPAPSPTSAPSPTPALSPLELALANWLDGTTSRPSPWWTVLGGPTGNSQQAPLGVVQDIDWLDAVTIAGTLLAVETPPGGHPVAFIGLQLSDGHRYFVPLRVDGLSMPRPPVMVEIFTEDLDMGLSPKFCTSGIGSKRPDFSACYQNYEALLSGEFDGSAIYFDMYVKTPWWCARRDAPAAFCVALSDAVSTNAELSRFARLESFATPPGFVNDESPRVPELLMTMGTLSVLDFCAPTCT